MEVDEALSSSRRDTAPSDGLASLVFALASLLPSRALKRRANRLQTPTGRLNLLCRLNRRRARAPSRRSAPQGEGALQPAQCEGHHQQHQRRSGGSASEPAASPPRSGTTPCPAGGGGTTPRASRPATRLARQRTGASRAGATAFRRLLFMLFMQQAREKTAKWRREAPWAGVSLLEEIDSNKRAVVYSALSRVT